MQSNMCASSFDNSRAMGSYYYGMVQHLKEEDEYILIFIRYGHVIEHEIDDNGMLWCEFFELKRLSDNEGDCQNEVKSIFLLAYATTIARSRNYLY